jgi:DNA-binding MarR family transcriptional regulator
LDFISDGTAAQVMQPSRFKILQYLRSTDEPQYVEHIAETLKIHPRMVSHHLDILQEQGLIESRYEVANVAGSRRALAVRLSTATPKATEVLRQIRERAK